MHSSLDNLAHTACPTQRAASFFIFSKRSRSISVSFMKCILLFLAISISSFLNDFSKLQRSVKWSYFKYTFQVCRLCSKQRCMEQMLAKPSTLRKWYCSHGDKTFAPFTCTCSYADCAKVNVYIIRPFFFNLSELSHFYLYVERIQT